MEKLLMYTIIGLIILLIIIAGPIGLVRNTNEKNYMKNKHVEEAFNESQKTLFTLKADISVQNTEDSILAGEPECKMIFTVNKFDALYKSNPGTLTNVDIAVIINRLKVDTETVTPRYDTGKKSYVINNPFGLTGDIVGYGLPRHKNETYFEQTIFFTFWNASNRCYQLNKDQNKQSALIDMCQNSWLGTAAVNVEIPNTKMNCNICKTCGNGWFNTCDKTKCHNIDSNCYYQEHALGRDECKDCRIFKNKADIEKNCQVFDSKDACNVCPNALGYVKKCQWIDSTFGAKCVDIAGSGCEICSGTTGTNPTKEEIKTYIDNSIDKIGLEYSDLKNLIGAQMYQESGCKQFDVNYQSITCSFAGAIGIMQLMPSTAADVLGDATKACDTPTNIYGGIKYQIQMLNEFKNCQNSMEFALAAYNAGPDRVKYALRQCAPSCDDCSCNFCTFDAVKNYLPAETQGYVENIMNNINNADKNCYI